MATIWKTAVFLAGLTAFESSAMAQETFDCSSKITRSNIVRCAVSASLAVKGGHETVVALEGRRTAADHVLPSNPVLSLSGAHRGSNGGEPRAFNWSATLSQEIEIAGQRGSRLRTAEAEIGAQEKRVLLSKREAALSAWTAFFEVAAAQEEQRLAERILSASERMSAATRARADKGVGTTIDADIADAATLRIVRSKLAADRSLAIAKAQVSYLVGRDPTATPPIVEGDLRPLDGIPVVAVGMDSRPEVQVAEASRLANLARAEGFRRARVPNPTVSFFAQNDGYNERVLGVGLSLPIPLPSSVGRSYAGEIAEAEALAKNASTLKTQVERGIQLDIATASASYTTHRKAVDAFTEERMQRAENSLRELGQEVEVGRLSMRDAIVSQQGLIELLQAYVAERKALCLASLEMARVLGIAVEGGGR